MKSHHKRKQPCGGSGGAVNQGGLSRSVATWSTGSLCSASVVLGASILISACGGLGGGDNGPSGVARVGYPAGPYGTAVGETLEDLQLTDTDDHSFALHQIFLDGHNRLLLVNTAAGWCGACIEEQPALQGLHDEYAARGLFVLVALFEDSQFRPADAELARSWKAQYDLDFKVTADPSFTLSRYYDRALTPMNMLVDVDTMSILRIGTGWDPSAILAIVEARL